MQVIRQAPARQYVSVQYGYGNTQGGRKYTVVATLLDYFAGPHLTMLGYVVRTKNGLRRMYML